MKQIAPVVPLEFAPSIVQALDKVYHREGEWISGNFRCDECAKMVRGRKTMAIKSTSDYLIVYLKRYDVNMHKIKETFQIDEHLDLSKWSDAVINKVWLFF
jgi:ubiquitin C-terminal hydrolase